MIEKKILEQANEQKKSKRLLETRKPELVESGKNKIK